MYCPARTRRCSVWLALMAIAMIGVAPLRAQTTSASIQGTVSDTTGLLPGAVDRGQRHPEWLHLRGDE